VVREKALSTNYPAMGIMGGIIVGTAYRKRFIFRFSCLRSLNDMCCESLWLDCAEAVISTERRLSDCGLSIIEPVEDCGDPIIP
jgi:hypothetical protein